MLVRATLLAIAIAVGCADTIVVDENLCGNLVVEPGEDCDRPDGLCTSTCHFACAVDSAATCDVVDGKPALDGTCCPSGASCGADGACRWPAGDFRSDFASAPFGMYDFAVADIDGDHVDDILGSSAGDVIALYGEPDAPFTRQLSRPGVPAAAVAIGDLVGSAVGEVDGRPDVVFTGRRGLYVFETTSGTPEPIAFPHAVDPERTFLRTAGVQDVVAPFLQHQVLLAVEAGRVVLGEITPTGASFGLPCGRTIDSSVVNGEKLHAVASKRPGPDAEDVLVVAVPLLFRASNPDQCSESQPQHCGQLCLETIPVRGTPPVSLGYVPGPGETFVANVTLANCPDLVLPGPQLGVTPTTIVARGIGTPASCTIDLDNVVWVYGSPLASMVGGVGRDWLATSIGLYDLDSPLPRPGGASSPAEPNVLTGPPGGWVEVASGDFDGDGVADLAGRVSGISEIEIYERRDMQWRLERVPVIGGTLFGMVVGDFDADTFDDVALATVDSLATFQARISVAYSNGQSIAAPTAIATVTGFTGLAAAELRDGSLGPDLDVYDDLVVLHGSDVTYLYGNGDRVMTAPWQSPEPPFVLYVGSFVTGPQLVTYSIDASTEQFVLSGQILDLADRKFAPRGDTVDLAILQTHDTSVRLPDGSVLAMSSNPNIVSADIGCATFFDLEALTTRTVTCDELAPNIDPNRLGGIVRLEYVAGSPERLYALRVVEKPGGGEPDVFNELWMIERGSGQLVLGNPIDLAPLAREQLGSSRRLFFCAAFTSIELGKRPGYGAGRENAVACIHTDAGLEDPRTTVFFVFANDVPGEPPAWGRLDIEGLSPELKAGDVNGDGLEDLVVSGSTGTTVAYLQRECDARSTEGCR